MSRGAFIAIEGIDGAGTSSQARLLCKKLRSRGVLTHLTAEPSDGPVGRLIREQLGQLADPPDPAAMTLLFAADRMLHLNTEIDPLVDQGTLVISDRYVMSSLAYQSVEQPLEWVESLNRHARPPDLTVLLRVDPDVAAERRGLRGGAEEIYDKLQVQRQVAANYDELASLLTDHRVVVVDANLPFDEVAALLEAPVNQVIREQQGS